MNKENVLNIVTHSFNPGFNGGEQLNLTTKYIDQGRGEYYSYQEISLQSYQNSATFNLGIPITPENLRELANKLESANNKMRDWSYKNKGVSNPCCKGKIDIPFVGCSG